MKKKLIFGVTMLLATVYCSSVMAYSDGNGSEESPFQISSKADYQQFTDKVNKEGKSYEGVYFLLTCDLTDVTTAIGGSKWGGTFSGIFDGGGHKITANIKPDYGSGAGILGGIFGDIQGATIKNLTVSGKISGTAAGGICAGGSGNISNCYNSAEISGATIGGICGSFSGSITNCHNSGEVSLADIFKATGIGVAGGICGDLLFRGLTDEYNITYCSNLGKVTGAIAGGICGKSRFFGGKYNITYCSNRGEVLGAIAGGICGQINGETSFSMESRLSISNCRNMGAIWVTHTGKKSSRPDDDGIAFSGGIAGMLIASTEAEINNCYNTGGINSTGAKIVSGGICGYFSNQSGSISNCYNAGNIAGEGIQDDVSNAVVGGIAGINGNTIKNCFAITLNATYKTTKSSAGRIAGSNKSKIENCHAATDMLLNGKTVSSSDPTSNDGQDQASSDTFGNKEWIEKNLGWNFEIWKPGNSASPYPTIEY
jgi:hypothetical protein